MSLSIECIAVVVFSIGSWAISENCLVLRRRNIAICLGILIKLSRLDEHISLRQYYNNNAYRIICLAVICCDVHLISQNSWPPLNQEWNSAFPHKQAVDSKRAQSANVCLKVGHRYSAWSPGSVLLSSLCLNDSAAELHNQASNINRHTTFVDYANDRLGKGLLFGSLSELIMVRLLFW